MYGADSSNITRALGGVPVNIAFGELYTALEKKTVDGAITSATNAEPMKFFEVSKIINYWFLAGASSEWLVTNQKAWDGLPKDLQQIVLDAASLEKRGVHTVTVVWDNFEKAARMQARLQAVPDLMLVVIPHRKGGETADDQRRKAEAALGEMLTKLVEPI